MAKKITLSEREAIFELLAKNEPIGSIALSLNRHRSTIYREIARLPGDYLPSAAQNDATLKQKNSKRRNKFQNEDLKNIVNEKILEKWSPEQISGRLKILYPDDYLMHVSPETIYKYIYGLIDEKERTNLIKHLRHRKKYRYSRKGKNEKRGRIPNLISIHERPKSVEKRFEIGHWEGDLIVGKNHKSAIGTIVERKTRFTIIVPLFNGKDSESTVQAFIKEFKKLPKCLKKTLTYDRGTEMTCHEKLTLHTGIKVYFADPHSPYQRGTNENTNGLIRTFFPKKTDFSKHTLEDFIKVQILLNSRPRKILKYSTPKEALNSHI